MLWILLLLLLLLFLLFKRRVSSFTSDSIKIDKVFLLSLPSSSDRRTSFLNSYNSLKTGLPLEIISGIDTKIPQNAEPYKHLVDPERYNNMYTYDTGTPRPNHTYFNSGALGCYLGHMEFYKRCFEQNLKYALIFEDNVTFDPSFVDQLNKALENVPKNFDILFLTNIFGFVKDTEIKKGMYKIKWVMGTKAYIINVENMKKYHSLFYPIANHIDLNYEKLIYNGANVYLTKLQSIHVDLGKSVIGHGSVLNDIYFTHFTNLKQSDITRI
jgi:GR25 family glycosyltransferase involved in LPS biosynthesis